MIRHYLKSGLRSLWKNKTYTVINIFGLALGLSSCLLISSYVLNEISYDNFYRRIMGSFTLSVPLTYYAMNQWLRNFAYKIEIQWWIFAIAGSITLIVASITIGFKTWQAAVKNPADILRYE
jgi:hypothetical protein